MNQVTQDNQIQRRIQGCCNIQDGALYDNQQGLPVVNYYDKALHSGCCSSPRPDSEIKGECKVRDLVKSIEFYNEKFDKFERDNRKKEEKINELEEKTKKMDKKN